MRRFSALPLSILGGIAKGNFGLRALQGRQPLVLAVLLIFLTRVLVLGERRLMLRGSGFWVKKRVYCGRVAVLDVSRNRRAGPRTTCQVGVASAAATRLTDGRMVPTSGGPTPPTAARGAVLRMRTDCGDQLVGGAATRRESLPLVFAAQ